jgi:hypothetical protein
MAIKTLNRKLYYKTGNKLIHGCCYAVMKITLLNFHEEKCWNVLGIDDGVSQPAALSKPLR